MQNFTADIKMERLNWDFFTILSNVIEIKVSSFLQETCSKWVETFLHSVDSPFNLYIYFNFTLLNSFPAIAEKEDEFQAMRTQKRKKKSPHQRTTLTISTGYMRTPPKKKNNPQKSTTRLWKRARTSRPRSMCLREVNNHRKAQHLRPGKELLKEANSSNRHPRDMDQILRNVSGED